MKTSPWMIYGATGYTAKLIIELCLKEGIAPVLAGRNYLQLEAMGKQYGLETRCFGLENTDEVAHQIRDLKLVLHCAGPYSKTSQPMLEGCLKSKVNYLDITGEWPVFERIFAQDALCKEAGISAIPGVGFDVVPTDCLAAKVAAAVPDAKFLRLGFVGVGAKLSPGTAKTAAESLGADSIVRENGKLVPIAPFSRSLDINFGKKTLACYAIPWGDVVTAFASTKIPNIAVYSYFPHSVARSMRLINRLGKKILQHAATQSLFKQSISYMVKGPDEQQRMNSFMLLWAEVESADGRRYALRAKVPEGYTFTAVAALASVKRVLRGDCGKGALTPSLAFGADFLDSLPGCSITPVT